jgi:hypothetical protein
MKSFTGHLCLEVADRVAILFVIAAFVDIATDKTESYIADCALTTAGK